jgi:Zn-dependent M16 (insulinase) family peptidase
MPQPVVPDVPFQPGDEIRGFQVVAVTPVEQLGAVACQFEHAASGARVLHIYCDDPENAFTINVPTPPPDDTGMPHILEHMVLAGSEKFPVKEPFFEMIKMSMATFINAMTGYDTTYYPVCSNVEQDLFNLADVYFDAVFHPLLTPATFAREAHHLAPADPANPSGLLRIAGIVYSEMKGVFSNPESILAREAVRQLLPDTCYGRDSGGDPAAIPSLTHEALLKFHATHYHPSNACFVLYGNIPTLRFLDFLAPRLAPYTRAPRTPLPERQPRWSEPRLHRESYPTAPGEPVEEKTYLLMSWLAGDNRDPVDAAAMRILSLLLLGHEAAPLHRTLIDSHIGTNLVMSGNSDIGSESSFHVGLEGAEPERLDTFRQLVLDTLRKAAGTPFSDEQIQTAFQQAAYETLEIAPMFPLHTVFRVVAAWMSDLDPLTYLRDASHYQELRRIHAGDPQYFNRLIRERLLDNPHRLDLVLAPDAALEARREEESARDLAARRAALDDEGMRAIAAAAEALERDNGTPNPPEAVARLPQLKISDIPAEPRRIDTTVHTLDSGATLLVNAMPTNSIVYLILQFDLTGLPGHLWACLPRYAEALNKFGTATADFATLATRIGANTGGIRAGVGLHTPVDQPDRLVPVLNISLKTLDERVTPALDLLGDLLFSLNPRDTARMRDVLVQARAATRTGIVQNGATIVRLQAGRHFNEIGHLANVTSGLPQLALLEGWLADFDNGNREVAEAIEAIRDFLLNRRRVTASVTASPSSTETIRARLDTWLGRMADAPVMPGDTGFAPARPGAVEGLAAALQIAHCAMVMPAPHLSHPDEPLLAVGAHLVAMDYLLPEIRLKGNAYGAGFTHQSLTGTFTLHSYRDPRLTETIAVFRRVADFVRQAVWSQGDIDRGIIGVAKRDEKPLRPSEATGVALQRHMIGESFERRCRRRRQLLEATPDNVRQALLQALEAGLPQAAICVMTNRSRLEQARQTLGSLTIEDVLK